MPNDDLKDQQQQQQQQRRVWQRPAIANGNDDEVKDDNGAGARNAHLSELMIAAEARKKKGLFGAAEAAKAELDKIGQAIADVRNCVLLCAPIKGTERADQKVKEDYGGDWFELKDVARITLALRDPTKKSMDDLVADMQRMFRKENNYSVLKDKATDPDEDPCGYAGHNFVLRFGMVAVKPGDVPAMLAGQRTAVTSSANLQRVTMDEDQVRARLGNSTPAFYGRAGEIQVNNIPLMYGKMSQLSFRKSFGALVYLQCQSRYGLDGGAGHLMYEIWRAAPTSNEGVAAAALSKRYYRRFRGLDPKPSGKDQLRADVTHFLMNLPEHLKH